MLHICNGTITVSFEYRACRPSSCHSGANLLDKKNRLLWFHRVARYGVCDCFWDTDAAYVRDSSILSFITRHTYFVRQSARYGGCAYKVGYHEVHSHWTITLVFINLMS